MISWNPGAERFKGYSAGEVLGSHFSQFYTPEDRDAGRPERALAVASEAGRFEAEGWRLRKDGTRFWAHVVIDPVRRGNELVGYAKITRDLTEQRAAERALRQSEELFRILVEGVTDYAIYMLDPGGKVISWNAGAERIKGYKPDEIIGEHFSRFYRPEEVGAGAPAEALSIARATGHFEKEGWRLRSDGTRFWAHVVIDPITADDGEIIGFAKITRDITERANAQRELETAREALYQSQKMEAIGQLTGGVAHDFNNLLAAILGSLDLLRKRLPHDPRTTPLLENAIQGAERGAILTQRMLAFARKQELKLEAVDIPHLVRGMSEFIRRSIGPNVDVQMRFAEVLPRAQTDPYQLETALLNLVVNARDALPNGGEIAITADQVSVSKTEGERRAGSFVRLSVSDNGTGMPAEIAAKVTEPFFTTKGVGKGTGLGLSMVQGLAGQSGGWIEIHSEVGKGTRIDLWLPLATAEFPTAGSPVTEAIQETCKRLVVLAVDDDPLVLTNTVAMLDELGHNVLAANSGDEAMVIFQRHPEIDLVLTDEVMPGLSGSQLAERVRELRPTAAVALVSGYADLHPTPGRGLADLPRLAKPFTLAQLVGFIDELALDSHHAAH
ncbi:hybrid sensor histidine kinase/response regulator [Brevundimonas sp. GW460-12-10-14-LB2]|uniref:hybrid sensor histidine kinase/response regulator n=1 Tax=Brevundimonas sp. GW460-12-10-14-LB2 TaxID=1827469 RepID=UPI0007BCB36A|nr:PAS domain-containing sensor histidine kinase [Brevundimonas sp. GW460-12-10-14-LB2]ANC53102.1 hybrid sensor histidine kinase/response regulator [Brevundimonas sp. GW460-12-10-14-LB2]